MAHYAVLDGNNKVLECFVGIDETENAPDGFEDWEAWYSDFKGKTVKRYSYNTYGNVHSEGGTPFRGNSAGIGSVYLPEEDIFVPKKPKDSWVLSDNYIWEPPIPYPDSEDSYYWDEEAYQADNTKGWTLYEGAE